MKQSVKEMIANKFLCEMMKRYQSSHMEASFAKNIPMRFVKEFQHHFPGAFRFKYRGPSVTQCQGMYGFRYDRPQTFCHKEWATSFALYPVKKPGCVPYKRWQQYLNGRGSTA